MVRKTAKKPANKVVPADFVPDSKNRLDTRYCPASSSSN
jgi:hypothetical protein